jgi:serine/threonine-protein kinase HipA
MLPQNGATTSHILKQPNEQFPDLLENELYCMALARGSGLSVPDSGRVSRDMRALWVERFDRVAADSAFRRPIRKLHQEDFCQVLKVEPEGKYENDGGPGIRACSEVILRFSGLPVRDLPSLVRWICFNYLIGNEDAHAKNLALLYADSGLCLTPHYDLVSTEVYRDLERSLAMKIGRSWDIRNVQKSDWKLLAGRVGLPWDRVRVILLELAESVSSAAADVARRCEEEVGEGTVYSKISGIVERHSRQLTREVIVR